MNEFDYTTTPAPAAAPTGRRYPPSSWPSKDQLTYTKELMTVFLLALGTTWIIYMLFKNPSKIVAGAGAQHLDLGAVS